MKALGIPEDRICKTITNPRTRKPVAPMTLARAFAAELASGATEVHALVGNFILCAILGKKPALGDAIKSEQVRMTAAIFYAKTKMGWKETVVNEPANKDDKPVLVERCAAAADRRGRPDQGAQRTEGRIGDRLLARTARRSAKSRGRRADPRDGARRSHRVRIRLALSRPARTTAARRILAGMAADGRAWLWQDPPALRTQQAPADVAQRCGRHHL